MSVRLLERVDLAANAALRFVDAVTGAPVRDGLRCELRRVADGALVARSVATPSGMHHWPSLGSLWQPSASPPMPARAEVWVRDGLERFLPLRLQWPPMADTITDVTLCSAPARATPAGAATLQAWLADAAGAAVAWARVVATGTGGAPVPGMSDAEGRLTLHLPFPRPERRAGPSSPPAPMSPPLPGAAVAGLVALAFQHGPAVAAEAAGRSAPRLDLWLAQPACAALADVDGSTWPAARVASGAPLVLRTRGLPPDRSDLRLVPL